MKNRTGLHESNSSARRIFANTWLLYLRAAFTLALGLFSTRYILDALGVENFGIYSLVGSVIAFLSFLNNSMGEATTRFLTFHQKDAENGTLARVFTTGTLLQLLIGIFIVLAFEAGSIFLFKGGLNIDASRVGAAKFVFHCMVVSSFFTVIGATYDGCIVAHERFIFYTVFSFVETTGKFAIALLLYCTPFDRLESYGLLVTILSISGFCARLVYCQVNFSEAKVNFGFYDKQILSKLASFSVWVLIDLMSSFFRFNFMDILLNTFLGTLANAAFAVSKQVSGSLLSFSSSLFAASRPQIVRAVSANNTEGAVAKTLSISRLAFFLMSLFSLPLLVEMPYVLELWLKHPPKFAASFCRLSLISNLFALMTIRGFSALLDGIGRIKAYRITMSIGNLLAFPIAYLLLRQGFPPYAIYFGILTADIFQVFASVYFTVRYTDLTWNRYLKEIPLRLLPISGGILILLFWIPWPADMHPFIKLVFTTVISSILLIVLFWIILKQDEKRFAKDLWTRIRGRLGQVTE